jgi:hypothetical protein
MPDRQSGNHHDEADDVADQGPGPHTRLANDDVAEGHSAQITIRSGAKPNRTVVMVTKQIKATTTQPYASHSQPKIN